MTAFEDFVNDEIGNRIASQEATQTAGSYPRFTGVAKLTTERTPAEVKSDIGALGDVVDDTTPQLGGILDVNGNEIQSVGGTDIDIHSDGEIILEVGDNAGVKSVSIRDSDGVEIAFIDSNGNLSIAGLANGRNLSSDGTKLDGIEAGADVTDATNVNAAGAVMETDFAAKGDLLSATADDTPAILTVGANDKILVADSAEATGLRYGGVPGGYGWPQPPLYVRINETAEEISRGRARPTSGVQWFEGVHVVASIAADREFYAYWQLPSIFPEGTMEVLLQVVAKSEPGSGETLIITMDWDDYAENADLDAISFNNEGTETITTTAGVDVFKLFQVSHVFGTVPAPDTFLVVRFTYEVLSTFAIDSVTRLGIRWV